jgi:hypothetical protein
LTELSFFNQSKTTCQVTFGPIKLFQTLSPKKHKRHVQ